MENRRTLRRKRKKQVKRKHEQDINLLFENVDKIIEEIPNITYDDQFKLLIIFLKKLEND